MKRIGNILELDGLPVGTWVVIFSEGGQLKDFLAKEGDRFKSFYMEAAGTAQDVSVAKDLIYALTEEHEQRFFVLRFVRLFLPRLKLPKEQVLNFRSDQELLFGIETEMDPRFMVVDNEPSEVGEVKETHGSYIDSNGGLVTYGSAIPTGLKVPWNDALTFEAFMALPPGTPILIHDKGKGLVSLNFKWDEEHLGEVLQGEFSRWVMWFDPERDDIRLEWMTKAKGMLDHAKAYYFFEMYDVIAILTGGGLVDFLQAFMTYIFSERVYGRLPAAEQTPFYFPPHLRLQYCKPPAPGTALSDEDMAFLQKIGEQKQVSRVAWREEYEEE
jgi:hypothetical protein